MQGYKKKISDETNKDEKNIYSRTYYEENKEVMNNKAKEKVDCDICGSSLRLSGLAKHRKTDKCIHFNKKNNATISL